MTEVLLNTSQINNWNDFHCEFKKIMGFPEFYGMNGDAWIDCMSDLRDDTRMSNFLIKDKEILVIKISETTSFYKRQPEIFEGLIEMVAFVNKERNINENFQPSIGLMFL